MNKRTVSVRRLTAMSMMAAIATALMFFETPLPFMPPFLKLDVSVTPILIGSFAFGPVQGVMMALLKAFIHILSTQTAGVGELADFLVTSAYALSAGTVYRVWHTRKGAMAACGTALAASVIVAALANYYILLPFYASAYMPYDAIIAACRALNPAITDLRGYILYGVVPFNLIKGLLVCGVTMLVYKRISGFIHSWTEGKKS